MKGRLRGEVAREVVKGSIGFASKMGESDEKHWLDRYPVKVGQCALKKHWVGRGGKDRNCEVCKRTKITRATCRKRFGNPVPRAQHFGALLTADHKVLNEGCESRKNHRYTVVKQNLLRRWKGVYECFSSRRKKPKVIYTDSSLNFGKVCEESSWNQCTLTPHRSETNGISEGAVRRMKERNSAVLL